MIKLEIDKNINIKQMAKKKSNKKNYEEIEYYSLSPETKKGIIIILLFTLAVLFILSFLDLAGKAGFYIDMGVGIAFGWGRFVLPIILIVLAYALCRPAKYNITLSNYIGIVIFVFSLQSILHLKLPLEKSFDLCFSGLGGGMVGYALSYPLMLYLGFWASLIILIGLFFVSVLLMFNTSIESLFNSLDGIKNISPNLKKNKEEEEYDDEETEEPNEDEEFEQPTEDPDTTVEDVKFSPSRIIDKKTEKKKETTFKSPKIRVDLPLKLLDGKKSKPTSGDIKVGKEKIRSTLENFKIDVEMDEVKVGPTVTQYTLKPAQGVKLSRITNLNNDLALALAAHPIRIEAPIPGKSLVGIEVPNQKPAMVRIREIIESTAFKNQNTNLMAAIGKDVSGKCWADDIAKMPHLLVAGATGSGKSVCLNTIITSLLYQNNPDSLRLILVDPKRVEFPIYNGIPHLLTPVITDVTKTVYALRWAISEMDRRFDVLAQEKKRNIDSYNKTAKEKMPKLVIIIDELADLMVAAAAEVEACIIRLTQMARAVGIHLIVATQRPSVDVITGLIKANIPARIAFSVASLMDSRTILDSAGAEKLVGKGDCLFVSPKFGKPRRLQGAFISDEETKRIVNYLKNACQGETDYHDDITEKPSSSSTSFDFNGGEEDELFDEAKKTVIQAGKASASFLQRKLRVGYARAARLIDLLEEAGIVGPADGAKPRDILVDKNQMQSASPEDSIPAETGTSKNQEQDFSSSEDSYEENEPDTYTDDSEKDEEDNDYDKDIENEETQNDFEQEDEENNQDKDEDEDLYEEEDKNDGNKKRRSPDDEIY